MSSGKSVGDIDELFNIVMIGNSGVGKSCMLMQYVEHSFTTNFFNTIGVDFKMKTLPIDDKEVRLQIWDTAGQEKFNSITCNYYRKAHGIMIVFDITDLESFEAVKKWLAEIRNYAQDDVSKILIGNKCDLESKRQVTIEDAKRFAAENSMEYLETSAAEEVNIDNAFRKMAKMLLARFNKNSAVDSTDPTKSGLLQTMRKNKTKTGCCK